MRLAIFQGMELTMKTDIFRFITMALVVYLPSLGSAETWYVHPGYTLSKTQVALNVCGNGDTVLQCSPFDLDMNICYTCGLRKV